MTATPPLPFAAVADALRRARTVYLTVHERPDGDALGSQIALAAACRAHGARVWMANADPVPARYDFLPGTRAIRTGTAGLPARFDAAVVLECSTLTRAGRCGPVARRARTVINVDHHLNNRMYGRLNLVDPAAPATVLLADRIRELMGVAFTREIAMGFYVGLYTETGGFRYNNTTPEGLALASRLVAAGVNPREVGEAVFERAPLRRLKLLGRALESMTVRDRVCWMSVSREDFASVRATEEDTEDFVDYPRMIKGVAVAVFMRETPAGVRASLRAKADVPVNRIAEQFGGGGHAYAAGCTLPRVRLDEARRRLAAAIRTALRSRRA